MVLRVGSELRDGSSAAGAVDNPCNLNQRGAMSAAKAHCDLSRDRASTTGLLSKSGSSSCADQRVEVENPKEKPMRARKKNQLLVGINRNPIESEGPMFFFFLSKRPHHLI
jgi:hypothetical protein